MDETVYDSGLTAESLDAINLDDGSAESAAIQERAERRAEELLAQRDAERAAQAERLADIEAARSGDVQALGEKQLRRILGDLDKQTQQQQVEAMQLEALAPGGVANKAVEEFFHELPEEIQRELSGKQYPGARPAAFKSFLRDVARLQAEHLARGGQTRSSRDEEREAPTSGRTARRELTPEEYGDLTFEERQRIRREAPQVLARMAKRYGGGE